MAGEEQLEFEQELLRLQMEESREALAHKIERLEEKVAENVENAAASVADATASVMESVQNVSASVAETVDSVTDAVQGTVDSVRQSFEETVGSVKQVFDWKQQYEKHTLLILAGAVAVGYMGGRLLSTPTSKSENQDQKFLVEDQFETRLEPSPPESRYPLDKSLAARLSKRSVNGFHSDVNSNGFPANEIPEETIGTKPPSQPSGSIWTNLLGETFGAEAEKLQQFAIGMALGTLRDVLVGQVPQPVRRPLTEVFNDLTEKLGGTLQHETAFAPADVEVAPASNG